MDFCGSAEGQCVAVCEAVGRPQNYRFYKSRAHLLSENLREFPIYFQNCSYREYRCSQRLRHRTSPTKISDPSKRRNRRSMKMFSCGGSLRFVFRSDEDTRGKPLHPNCPLLPGQLLVVYRHDVKHEGRENVMLPDQIKQWIADSHFTSPRETFQALTKLIDRGEFQGIPTHLITPWNTSYWWAVSLETRLGTNGDKWLAAHEYLQRQPLVNLRILDAFC